MRLKKALTRSTLLAITATFTNAQEAIIPPPPEEKCVMYDHCGKKFFFGGELNCAYDGPPKPLPHSSLSTLKEVCGKSFPPTTCCSASQLDNLQSSLSLLYSFVASCPACYHNLAQFFCNFTCSPTQASFVDITGTQKSTEKEGKDMVTRANVYLTSHYGQALFDSCQNIKFSAGNGYAMDFFAPGARESGYLTLFRALGKENPPLGSPFQIDFPEPYQAPAVSRPLDEEVKPCHIEDPSYRCACLDCPTVCPSLPHLDAPITDADRCMIGVWLCTSVIAFWVWLAATFAVLVYFGRSWLSKLRGIWRREMSKFRKRRRRRVAGREGQPLITEGNRTPSPLNDDTDLERRQSLSTQSSSSSPPASPSLRPSADLSRSWRKSHRMLAFLEDLYFELGRITARYPYIMIVLSLSFLFTCSLGWIFHWDVETEPKEMWVDKQGKAWRAERGFEAIGPSFRAAQVIIRVPDNTDWMTEGNDRLDTAVDSVNSPEDEEVSVVREDTLRGVFFLVDQIKALSTPMENLTLADLCYKPSASIATSSSAPVMTLKPAPAECLIESVTEYWEGHIDRLDSNWKAQLAGCTKQPTTCLPASQVPLDPKVLFGGVPGLEDHAPPMAMAEYMKAKAYVITFLLNSPVPGNGAKSHSTTVEEWEREMENYLENLEPFRGTVKGYGKVNLKDVRISYMTESSIKREVSRATNADVLNVTLSYLAMFIYVSASLGKRSGFTQAVKGFKSYKAALVNSRLLLGASGVLLVLASISAALGILSAYGVKTTYISMEVIPFLLLAIGVDNLFLITDAFDQNWEYDESYTNIKTGSPVVEPSSPASLANGRVGSDPVQPRRSNPTLVRATARALAKVGPSLTMSSISQTIALLVGWMIAVPAIASFSLFAAMSIIINFSMQMFCFVSLMVLDAKGLLRKRKFCFSIDDDAVAHAEEGTSPRSTQAGSSTIDSPNSVVDSQPVPRQSRLSVANPDNSAFMPDAGAGTDDDDDDEDEDQVMLPAQQVAKESALDRIFSQYGVFVMRHPNFRLAVMAIAVITVIFSSVMIREIDFGLDQRIALPVDSFLVDYFDDQAEYLHVGPPVYFVVDHLNVTTHEGQRQLCGRFPAACDEYSLLNILEEERKRPEASFINTPTSSWIDDFFLWLDPKSACCRKKFNFDGDSQICDPYEKGCDPCWSEERYPQDMPQGEDFMDLLRVFLTAKPTPACPIAGGPSYHNSVLIDETLNTVKASYFRTSYRPLRNQPDFINAMASARRISQEILDTAHRRNDSSAGKMRVYSYSIFHIFFEQYFGIINIMVWVFVALIIGEVLISRLILGSWRTGLSLSVLLLMMTATFMGLVMAPFNIAFNSVSLVNLLMGVGGLFVEFTTHLAHKYLISPGSRSERSAIALSSIGPVMLTGIITTKLIGFLVLALAHKSLIFTTYYFAMYLGLVVVGAIYSLLVLPPVLVFLGDEVMICGRLPSEMQALENEIEREE